MLDELRQKYRFSSGIAPAVPSASAVHASGPVSCTRAAACYEKQAGMLALKDILYQTWKNRKKRKQDNTRRPLFKAAFFVYRKPIARRVVQKKTNVDNGKRKTSFAILGVRSGNCTSKQREVIQK